MVAAAGTPITSTRVEGTFEQQFIVDHVAFAYSSADARPYDVRARLIERVRGGNPPGPASVLWEVGVTVLAPGSLTPAVPEGYACGMLTTVIAQKTEVGTPGAPQLALLRHKWAEAVKAESPDAVVFGGQHDWRDEWWTEAS